MLSHLEYLIIISYYLYVLGATVYLILDNRDPAATLGWVLLITFVPVAGFIVYLFTGKNSRIHRKQLKAYQIPVEDFIRKHHADSAEEHLLGMESVAATDPTGAKSRLSKILYTSSGAQISMNSSVEILFRGEDKFSSLLRDIRNAGESIHLAYYIWSKDPVTEMIREALFEKAAQGVEVRILVDDFGRFGMGERTKRFYRKNGVRVHSYARFLSPAKFHFVSYRNHRKIAVIDSRIGYTGGMNMSEKYTSVWRDIHMRLRGQAAVTLQKIFLVEWLNTTGEELSFNKYCPPLEEVYGRKYLQIVTSGPISRWHGVKKMFFEMISSAPRSIRIQTPFFIPDQCLQDALENAAQGGVEVDIMISRKLLDSQVPNWSADTYFRSLLESGCRIHHYEKSLLHAKTITVDGDYGAIGTANFDVRSFVLNYELMSVYYDKEMAQKMEASFAGDLEHCHSLTLKEHNSQSIWIRFRNSVARLFSPLM